jgi:hypothetical protein
MDDNCYNNNVYKQAEIKVEKDKWYKRFTKLVAANRDNQFTAMWEQNIVTDRNTPCNKSGTMLQGRRGTYLLKLLTIH